MLCAAGENQITRGSNEYLRATVCSGWALRSAYKLRSMTSGQWDLNALEALEREAVDVCDVLDIPERVRRPVPHYDPHIYHANHPQHPQPHHHHGHYHGQHAIHSSPGTMLISDDDIIDLELEDHIKHCTCTCNHMGYGNFMDYQVNTNAF